MIEPISDEDLRVAEAWARDLSYVPAVWVRRIIVRLRAAEAERDALRAK